MTKLKIKVTQDILEKSKHCTPGNAGSNCAIALSIRDLFPKAVVDGDDIIFSFGELKKAELPLNAKRFIMDFDCAYPQDRIRMTPIEFEIEIPDEVLEQINIDELRPLLVNHPTLELVTI